MFLSFFQATSKFPLIRINRLFSNAMQCDRQIVTVPSDYGHRSPTHSHLFMCPLSQYPLVRNTDHATQTGLDTSQLSSYYHLPLSSQLTFLIQIWISTFFNKCVHSIMNFLTSHANTPTGTHSTNNFPRGLEHTSTGQFTDRIMVNSSTDLYSLV